MTLQISSAAEKSKDKLVYRTFHSTRLGCILQTAKLATAVFLFTWSACAVAQGTAPSPFDDQSLAKADELLRKMTVEEKAGQTAQYFYVYPDETIPAEQIRKGEVGSYLFTTDPKVINH